ncbi:GGDEF domain-containing protein [Halomonas campisalis]|uniref:GGDEF domain-containing protein n=1 Tax=Billgrantia campisalis TaxID=74661 RepID=UPI0023B12204|nr:GGDEF domain-containing protein [Halomonas campisalis]MDR5861360.1 GGDEF domain-containing protein [Halomonas campisalis]
MTRQAPSSVELRASPTAQLVTVSIGVASCPTPGPCTSQQLMKTAGQALYEAKRQGRNRIQAQQVNREESLDA